MARLDTDNGFTILSGEDARNRSIDNSDTTTHFDLLASFFSERNPDILKDALLFKKYVAEMYLALNNNRAVTAVRQDTGRLVGQVYFTSFDRPQGNMFSANVVYPIKEIHRAFVLPEFRGERLYSRYMQPAIIDLAESTPGSVIRATVVEAVADMCIKAGYREHPNSELWLAYGQDPNHPELSPRELALELENYRFFVR